MNERSVREMSHALRVQALTRTLIELERSADHLARVARDAILELHSLQGTLPNEQEPDLVERGA